MVEFFLIWILGLIPSSFATEIGQALVKMESTSSSLKILTPAVPVQLEVRESESPFAVLEFESSDKDSSFIWDNQSLETVPHSSGIRFHFKVPIKEVDSVVQLIEIDPAGGIHNNKIDIRFPEYLEVTTNGQHKELDLPLIVPSVGLGSLSYRDDGVSLAEGVVNLRGDLKVPVSSLFIVSGYSQITLFPFASSNQNSIRFWVSAWSVGVPIPWVPKRWLVRIFAGSSLYFAIPSSSNFGYSPMIIFPQFFPEIRYRINETNELALVLKYAPLSTSLSIVDTKEWLGGLRVSYEREINHHRISVQGELENMRFYVNFTNLSVTQSFVLSAGYQF